MNFKETAVSAFRSILFLYVLAFITASIALLFVRFYIHPGPESLALHYNVLAGVDLFGRGYELYTIPGVAFAAVAMNALFSWAVRQSRSFLGWLLGAFSLVVSLVVLLSVVLLAKVN